MADETNPLQVELDEIKARLAAASEAERPVLERQFGERVKHLEARLKPPVKPIGGK